MEWRINPCQDFVSYRNVTVSSRCCGHSNCKYQTSYLCSKYDYGEFVFLQEQKHSLLGADNLNTAPREENGDRKEKGKLG
jgi:hypothetical protein